MQKMKGLDLPDNIFNWLTSYFSNRGHTTKLHIVHNVVSLVAFINVSIIHGSVIGPPSYVVPASDLHPSHTDNHLLKYADDTYLLVGSSNIASLAAEYDRVKTWAFNNNLRLNLSNTREMVIYRNKPSFDPLGPSTLAGAERVGSMRVLGVEVGANLSVGAHLNVILSNSASSIHALHMLRTHGLPQQQL